MSITNYNGAFIVSVEHHFRDSIPDEWYELTDPDDINCAIDTIEMLIDNADIIVDYPFEETSSEEVMNSVWHLYDNICKTYKVEV